MKVMSFFQQLPGVRTKAANKKLKDQRRTQVNQRTSQENQEFKNQEEFKTHEESLESRIKIQDLKNQDQDSRLKIQE